MGGIQGGGQILVRVAVRIPFRPVCLGFFFSYIASESKLLMYHLLLFAEALGARTRCGRISDGTDSERGRNKRMSGGLPEGREKADVSRIAGRDGTKNLFE